MKDRTASRLAWSAFALWVVFLVASIVLDLATKPVPGTPEQPIELFFALIPASFAIAGILILARQPRNRIGWILIIIGLAWVIPLESYGGFAHSRGLPGGALFIALSGPTWVPPIGLMGTVLLLRFPSGKLPSPGWRKVEWVTLASISMVTVAILFGSTDLADEGYPGLVNPLGIEALEQLLNALLVLILVIPISIVASAVSLILRFRRATGIERLQLKWLASTAAFVAAIYLVAMLASLGGNWSGTNTPTWMVWLQNVAFGSFALIPLAIGFAVLRYRLYDIDLVINRALVYGLLTALLIGVYVGIALGLGAVVRSLAGQENNAIVIAASTLAVAALFGPARRRIQGFIDRRFYRRKYDAARTLEAFSTRLRDQVDLEALSGELVGVVRDTMQPAHVTLWLRSGPPAHGTSS